MMSRNTPPMYAAQGGAVKMFNGGNVPNMEGFPEWLAGPGAAYANSDPRSNGAVYGVERAEFRR